MIEFFLRRPIFATVCSLVILLVGAVSIPILPIAQYPKISPPVVTVTAIYTGANAKAVESSVTTPLEQAINGLQGLRYISSTSGSDGTSTITATFDLSRDLDLAANDVQNAVNLAQGRLPNEVKLTGITVAKNSGTFIIGMGLTSTNPRFDPTFLSNYADLNIRDELRRIPGVNDVIIFGERKYAMRLWVDPKKLVDHGLTAGDVTNALTDQNVQVAAGAIGQPPTLGNQPYQYNVQATGRLTSPDQFANIILKATPDGGYVRVRDIGRTEIGAETYATDLQFDGRKGVGMGVQQANDGNALQMATDVRATMDRLQQKFPAGVSYHVAFDVTEFVKESIKEVVITLLIAIVLVVITIFVFLQDWRTTLIPAITIPISLIGTFALIKLLGFSINTLTLFGLTLATGLVVDDAIVVIENIARFIHDKKMSPFSAALEGMREILGAVVATSLVLLAVFIPVAFFPGTTGQLYKQFALTIAFSIAISLFNAITLTPVLSSLLLRDVPESHGGLWRIINGGIDGTRRGYHWLLPKLIAARWLVVVLFVGLFGLTGFLFLTAPTSFIPDEDQGYAIVSLQAPEGDSVDQTQRVQTQVENIIRAQPEIVDVFDIRGFSFTGAGPNKATMFMLLKPWGERKGAGHTVTDVLGRINFRLFTEVTGASVFAVNPPPIQGLGQQSGFTFELEDRGATPPQAMLGAAYQYILGPANQPTAPTFRTYTTFRTDSPQLQIDVDREKVKALGIPLATVFNTMQVYLGSVYVNDFDYLNRSYRVYVQADAPYRMKINDLQNIFVSTNPAVSGNGSVTYGPNAAASAAPAFVPLSGLASFHLVNSPPIITHYNLRRSIEISGTPAQGHGMGDALAFLQHQGNLLPPNLGYEFTGLSREEIEGGSQAALVFAFGLVFVFLVLSAQYESFTDPLIILLAVPLALLGAIGALLLGHHQSDIFAQIGYVMLIGLASKNAILIVEFANQLREEEGMSAVEAVTHAAETRLRPILMTSFAFILGILPLVTATGAGSASRQSLGTAVFGGMLVSTFLNLLVVPVLYVLVESFNERVGAGKNKHGKPGGEGRTSETTAPVHAGV